MGWYGVGRNCVLEFQVGFLAVGMSFQPTTKCGSALIVREVITKAARMKSLIRDLPQLLGKEILIYPDLAFSLGLT